ncbi:MAG: glycosyltransferase family 1 protein [Hyphomicrobiales bacterium]
MRVQIVSDAWHPQVNGVVRTVEYIVEESKKLGHEVSLITNGDLKTYSIPRYHDIKIAPFAKKHVSRLIKDFNPECVHIATEGPLGYAARNYCLKNNIEFTTCYHTNYPEYLKEMFGFPTRLTFAVLRWFHKPAKHTLATTERMAKDLRSNGFKNVSVWGRGVDTEQFVPEGEKAVQLDGPVFCYVGRVSLEKNIKAFLDLELPGTKMVVGDGVQLAELKAEYKDVYFAGNQNGDALAAHYRSADVFVFASKTDTFGLVLLEALACGVPVAAYPVRGPIDVLPDCEAAVMDDDLQKAALAALSLSKTKAREFAEANSWHECVKEFHTYF